MTNPSKHFRRRSVFRTTLEAMIDFHSRPNALPTLTPPPLIIQVLRDDRQSLTQGDILFRLWFGPIPVRWLARHEAGPIPSSFMDRQIEGPLAHWQHEHRFEATEQGIALTDEITFAHKAGWRGIITRLAFDGLALRFLFWYRHWRTRLALER